MDNRLTILKLSEKAEAYAKEVERETEYIVQIDDWQGNGANVTLDHDCKYILVKINEEEFKKESEGEIDFTIAHELTHGFLSLKKKYCQINCMRCGSEEKEAIFFLQTMIEDPVVDKTIYKKIINHLMLSILMILRKILGLYVI